MTPHHLNRLNILPDRYFMTNMPTKLPVSHINSQRSQRAVSDANIGSTYNQSAFISKLLHSRRVLSTPNPSNKPHTQPNINDFDIVLLLRMALSKIPSIPFQYIMDVVRWNLFNGTVSMDEANTFYWRMAIREQGIHPPDWIDRRHFFDIGAKFHTADNTPFIR